MKKYITIVLCSSILLVNSLVYTTNEFIKDTKKIKKESIANVKDDIGSYLEQSLRQLSKNLAEIGLVQQQIFDKIKDLVGAGDSLKSSFNGSVAQLKEQRHALQQFHHKLVQQEAELQKFLSCF